MASVETIPLTKLRELQLRSASQAGRPSHVSAASGLVRIGQHLYVIADDELCLGMFEVSGNAPGEWVRALPGALPLRAAERKRHKPDFESVLSLPALPSHPHGVLLMLGSGSTPSRTRGVLLPLSSAATPDPERSRIVDISPLFAAAAREVGPVNIEGAVATHERLKLIQRGNKGDGVNAIIDFELRAFCDGLNDGDLSAVRLSGVRRYELGSIRGIPFGFSDAAALSDGSLVYSAIAEDTDNAYADGPCAGAALGIIDRSGALQRTVNVQGGAKIEGVHAEKHGAHADLLLVTDADDPNIAATLYAARLPL
jgi:hypothetical protein